MMRGSLCSVLAIFLFWASGDEAGASIFFIADSDVLALRQAINTANSNNQDDLIILASNGTYTLLSVDNIDSFVGANGLPVIKPDNGHSITIAGNGSTIHRNTTGSPPPQFRIMQVASGAVIQLNALTMTAGVAVTSKGGGAIYSEGTLKLNSCVISGNTAIGQFDGQVNGPSNGGGIYNYLGTLTANDCTFSSNSATGRSSADGTGQPGGSGAGGAIYSIAGANSLTNCAFTNNSCTGGRGAMANSGFSGGNGGSAEAGAVYNAGSVTNCTFINNSSQGGTGGAAGSSNGRDGSGGTATGGAITAYSLLTIVDSSFSSNSATGGTSPGPEADGGGNGGAVALFADGTVTGSTFTGNSATARTFGGEGGAILALGSNSNVLIRNCTLATNSATDTAGGICGFSSDGVQLVNVNIYNCTLSGNTAPYGGGGVYSGGGSSFFYANTIFKLGSMGPNVGGISLTSQGHNITDDNGGPTPGNHFTGPGDMVNTNPQLVTTTPQDYGGPTKTIAIGVFGSSPAINNGDPIYATRRDQRGYFRTGAPDIGAFEYQGSVIGNVTSIARTGPNLADVTVSFEAVDRLTYRLQRKLSITDSNWQDINGVNDLTATGNDIEPITAPGDLSLGKAFYRVTFVSGP